MFRMKYGVGLATWVLLGVAAMGWAEAQSPDGSEAPESGRLRIFLLPIETNDEADEPLARRVLEQVATELSRRPDIEVVTQKDVQDMLKAEQQKTVLRCEQDDECVARILDQTQADQILSGSLGRVGDDILLTLTLLEPESSKALRRAGASFSEAAEMDARLPETLAELLGESQSELRFELEEKDVSFALFALESTGVAPETVQNLSQFLTVELSKIRGAEVISPKDIASILGVDRMKMLLGEDCDDQCMVDLSGALNVNYIVAGQVGRFDRDYVVALRLIDPREVQVVSREVITMRGPQEELSRAIRTVGRRLVGVDSDLPGQLAVTGPVAGAQVLVDGQAMGEIPARSEEPLPARRTALRVTRDGYYDWESDVFIQPGEENVVWAELDRKPNPITKKWWFWTLATGVAAGGITAGVLGSQQGSSSFDIDALIE